MAYVLLVDQIERQVLADRSAFISRGVPQEHWPDPYAERLAFDERLNDEPQPVEGVELEQLELRRALGVA